jgi:hypothetical protein
MYFMRGNGDAGGGWIKAATSRYRSGLLPVTEHAVTVDKSTLLFFVELRTVVRPPFDAALAAVLQHFQAVRLRGGHHRPGKQNNGYCNSN